LGATHVIDTRHDDVASHITDITGGGVDYVVETTGNGKMEHLAIDVLNPHGTIALLTGARGIDSLAEGRYFNELPEGTEPLKENCEVNQGCCDQIPALLGRATNSSSAADADVCGTPVRADQSGKTGALGADDRYQDERKYRVAV
jgi:hypothetical protein